MQLGRVIAALAPVEVLGATEGDVSGLAFDTQNVEPGNLFFCAPGARADGHDFADEAVAAGAVALVVERRLDVDCPQVVVADARLAMAHAADEYYGRPTEELPVAAVTGTNGKTTTAFLLHSILEAAGLRPGLLGTIESRVGGERREALRTTPEAIDLQRTFRAMLDAGDESCAMEATSHGAELKRLERVRFRSLAFTNLTQDHLDFHGTLERYFEAKRRLFTDTEPVPAAAINVGDEWGRRLAEELRGLARAPVLTFGFADDADLRPEGVALTPEGVSFRVDALELRSGLHGRFNVENVLAAAASARLFGLEDEAIARGVAALRGVPGRFEAVGASQDFTILVDYAHTPDSLENVLRSAREIATGGKLICVFGCGGDRDRGKRPLMGEVAARLADYSVITSDNPRGEDPEAIIEEIVSGWNGAGIVLPDRAEAIEHAIDRAERRDVVLIAGKGHEQGQEFADRKIPFDDREVARDVLRRLGAAA